MSEILYDKLLNIKTIGIREWAEEEMDYNRYEATPYYALEKLFQRVIIKRNDKFVDFGCGLGRVAFYVHNRFDIDVTGIEGNYDVYKELKQNYYRYQKVPNCKVKLNFEYVLAEEYGIDDRDNIFYFFNPFSITIFENVVQNILKSYEKNKREIKIILFYPLKEFQKYLLYRTPFKLIDIIQISDDDIEHDKFKVYQLL